MKRLVQLVLFGVALFVLVAMVQEWEVFARPFRGPDPVRASWSEDDRRAAADTVHETLRLMQHLYSSGGDVRFAERMPVSAEVLDEIEADLAWLGSQGRVQEMELAKLDVTALEPQDARRVEVRTRELWSVRVRQRGGTTVTAPLRVEVTRGRYLVGRDGSSWRVQAWEVLGGAEDGAP